MSLSGQVCLVTGATRGIGKGIALQLGGAGATVYITGRTLTPPPGKVGGSLQETAKEIRERGGNCIPVVCDHSNMDDVERLFEQISREQDGRLDVLVNNAYSAVQTIMDARNEKFYEKPPTMWDEVNNVGLRNHYFCTVYAARMMVPRQTGLIINVSSGGGLRYLFNVPYGVGKEALDRMAVDCAIELRKSSVAVISLWPGPVKTEMINANMETADAKVASMFQQGETPEFSGKCVVKLASDPNIMSRSGRIVTTADVADQHDLSDEDGSKPFNLFSVKHILQYGGHTWVATLIPQWLKLPRFVVALAGNKF